MRPLITALLITVAVILAVLLFGAPTGFTTYKFDKLSVSGAHVLLTPQTFSPNWDRTADIVSVTVSGACNNYKYSVLGIFSTDGTCAAGTLTSIASVVSDKPCSTLAGYCNFNGYMNWNGTYSSNQRVPDGKYCVISGCTSGTAELNSRDKVIEININSKAYPAKSTYVNGPVCGTKPKCSLQTSYFGWGTGCGKTATQNAGNRCNANSDTCLKQDTGSCKKNYGPAGNVVSCDPVSGVGICQATAVASVPGGH